MRAARGLGGVDGARLGLEVGLGLAAVAVGEEEEVTDRGTGVAAGIGLGRGLGGRLKPAGSEQTGGAAGCEHCG